jgi:hypothetical protein
VSLCIYKSGGRLVCLLHPPVLKLSPTTLSPRILLRFLLNARYSPLLPPRNLSRTIVLVGASSSIVYYSQSQRNRASYSSMATSSSEGDDLRDRAQQSPLASQRAKEQASEARGRRGFGNMFPLGAKDGFSQWVRGSRRPTLRSQR